MGSAPLANTGGNVDESSKLDFAQMTANARVGHMLDLFIKTLRKWCTV